jgi:hypothetical protein
MECEGATDRRPLKYAPRLIDVPPSDFGEESIVLWAAI